MAGAASQAAFCVAYAWSARRAAWPVALTAGGIAFALATVALTPIAPPLSALAPAVFVALAVAVRAMPRTSQEAGVGTPPPAWDLPARMVVATAFVIVLTASAGALGPRLTGLLAPFPLYAAVLTVFAHAFDGGDAAASVLRGLLMGLFAFAAFFLVLAAMLGTAGVAAAFAIAIAVALALQGASLWLLRRL
jgi:hypothetical protein